MTDQRTRRRAWSVMVLTALVAMACSAPKDRFAQATLASTSTSTEPATTSTLLPTSTAPSTAPPANGPWAYATANLAGLASECGNMTLLSARPDRDMVIAGVARQGLWSSVNGSTTWSRLGQGQGSAVITDRPSSITYDPSHPNTFWESGIYNGGGLYLTTDNGITFKQLGNLTQLRRVPYDGWRSQLATGLSGGRVRSRAGGQVRRRHLLAG
jgi:hypothetical protein